MTEKKLPVTGTEAFTPAEAANIEALVAYQPGSIVSRTIAKANGGTMTLFAFDRGQALSEHTAPFDAFVYVLDGQAELVIGGKAVHPTKGEMVLMPGGTPHAVNAPDRFKMLLVMIR